MIGYVVAFGGTATSGVSGNHIHNNADTRTCDPCDTSNNSLDHNMDKRNADAYHPLH